MSNSGCTKVRRKESVVNHSLGQPVFLVETMVKVALTELVLGATEGLDRRTLYPAQSNQSTHISYLQTKAPHDAMSRVHSRYTSFQRKALSPWGNSLAGLANPTIEPYLELSSNPVDSHFR